MFPLRGHQQDVAGPSANLSNCLTALSSVRRQTDKWRESHVCVVCKGGESLFVFFSLRQIQVVIPALAFDRAAVYIFIYICSTAAIDNRANLASVVLCGNAAARTVVHAGLSATDTHSQALYKVHPLTHMSRRGVPVKQTHTVFQSCTQKDRWQESYPTLCLHC